MTTHYTLSINETDKAKVLLLIDASIQAYNALGKKDLTSCQTDAVIAPVGFELVDSWTGVDAVFGHDKTVECYGLVFRSTEAPFRYIFAFRGTDSALDALDDVGAEHTAFKAHDAQANVPAEVKGEAGFYDVYTTSTTEVPSMQQQVFQLIDKYQASDKPIAELMITGHSLGAALTELFTLDVALSRPQIKASTINFASPRVGNQHFVDFYQAQPAQKDYQTQTLRVQNTYDKVPCVPLEKMGYQHTPNAFLVAFYKDALLGKLNYLDCHSANNYQAVLNAAANSENGICIDKDLKVPANGYAVTSEKPDPNTIGGLW